MSEIISAAFNTVVELNQASLTLSSSSRIRSDLSLIRHKYNFWYSRWNSPTRLRETVAAALWGIRGWENIEEILNSIVREGDGVQSGIAAMSAAADSPSGWRNNFKIFKPTSPPSELTSHVSVLGHTIDKLILYSDAMFESIHSKDGPVQGSRGSLLNLALVSRPASVELYGMCANSSARFSLGLDLLNNGTNLETSPVDSEYRLTYQLFTPDQRNSQQLQKLVVDIGPEMDSSKLESEEIVSASTEDVKLFETLEKTTVIQVPGHDFVAGSYMRFLRGPVPSIQLRSRPARLVEVLGQMHDPLDPTDEERLSLGAKIELASKVAEAGFFLLGTPWLASIGSKSTQRFKSNDMAKPTFSLQIQTLDVIDLLSVNPNALAEQSQLFRIGVLLTQIALDDPGHAIMSENMRDEANIIDVLPKIEHSMGTQYCKAAAFCLLQRSSDTHSRMPEKYKREHAGRWQRYLEDFLREYHLYVLSRSVLVKPPINVTNENRLEELRNTNNQLDGT